MPDTQIADIVKGSLDSTGSEIETVYSKINGTYAVYRTSERVVVQYADDNKLGAEQRLALSPLNPIRGQINGLVDGWRNSEDPEKKAAAKLFDRRVADALIVALQGDQSHALELLADLKADVLEERTSVARTQYLIVAFACGIALVAILAILTANSFNPDGIVSPLFLAAAIGIVGALFSVSIAIRGRTVLTDMQYRDNAVDAVLRIVIGAISAVVLFSLLRSEIVSFGFGGKQITLSSMITPAGVAAAIVIAFAAGFSERLIGDLLSQSVVSKIGAESSNPLAGEVSVKRTVGRGSEANEKNPLGRQRAEPTQGGVPSEEAEGHLHAEADDADCCLADKQLNAAELTDDIDLPEATGGVEKPS